MTWDCAGVGREDIVALPASAVGEQGEQWELGRDMVSLRCAKEALLGLQLIR